jgi:hypothetical protein
MSKIILVIKSLLKPAMKIIYLLVVEPKFFDVSIVTQNR